MSKMGAFIVAFLVFVSGLAIALFIGFAQSMADAPRYDNTPLWVFGIGTVLAILIVLSHWGPHIGW